MFSFNKLKVFLSKNMLSKKESCLVKGGKDLYSDTCIDKGTNHGYPPPFDAE